MSSLSICICEAVTISFKECLIFIRGRCLIIYLYDLLDYHCKSLIYLFYCILLYSAQLQAIQITLIDLYTHNDKKDLLKSVPRERMSDKP